MNDTADPPYDRGHRPLSQALRREVSLHGRLQEFCLLKKASRRAGTTSRRTFRFAMDPPLHPGTGKPIGPADLAPIFPMALIEQEMSRERWIDIPTEVREILRLWRPTPLRRARRLEAALRPPAASIIRTKAFRRPAATRPILPSPRSTTTNRKARNASRRKPAPVNGGRRSASPAMSLV